MTKKHLHMLHSSVVALAVAMTAANAQAATSESKPGMAQPGANAARTATANFLSPLKAAARAASRDLWGRVFKIHKKNLHEIGKVLVCLKQLIFNIKSSKITV